MKARTDAAITGFIFGGALFGFVLARLQYLSLTGRFCPAVPANDGSTGLPSACYWITQFPRYKVAMGLHLATSLPGGLLAVFQFVPAIRHRCILYHRIAGYIAVLLMVVGNAGAMMLADTAMGGIRIPLLHPSLKPPPPRRITPVPRLPD